MFYNYPFMSYMPMYYGMQQQALGNILNQRKGAYQANKPSEAASNMKKFTTGVFAGAVLVYSLVKVFKNEKISKFAKDACTKVIDALKI